MLPLSLNKMSAVIRKQLFQPISTRGPAAVDSVTESPGSSKGLQIVSGLHRACVKTDILKSCRWWLATPFESSQVEPI